MDDGQATAIVAIQQLIVAWATDLDRAQGLGVPALLDPECVYTARGVPRHGPDEVAAFYAARLEEILRTAPAPPTQRHVVSNLLVTLEGADRARIDFLLTYYVSPAPPPVRMAGGPAAVADVGMDCRRGADGRWRIASFDSAQVFVADP